MNIQKINLLFSTFLLAIVLSSDNMYFKSVHLKDITIEESDHKEKISLVYSKNFNEYKEDLYDILKIEK